MESRHLSKTCRVHELHDCIGDLLPDSRTGTIAIRSKLVGPYLTLHLGLIAVTPEHQVGNAPRSISSITLEGHSSNLY